MLNYEISAELITARPDSEIENKRDIHGLVEIVAYFKHISDVGTNGRATNNMSTNWSIAVNEVYCWAKVQNKQVSFETLAGYVHHRLEKLASAECAGDCRSNKAHPDHYWHKAREQLATEVLEYKRIMVP